MLLDFRKAFDSVNLVILLQKLRQADISVTAIKWIASYLTSREQAVLDTNGIASSLNKVVPQKSVLGALLFLVFIDDIVDGFDALVLYLMYADDLQIYSRFPLDKLQQ